LLLVGLLVESSPEQADAPDAAAAAARAAAATLGQLRLPVSTCSRILPSAPALSSYWEYSDLALASLCPGPLLDLAGDRMGGLGVYGRVSSRLRPRNASSFGDDASTSRSTSRPPLACVDPLEHRPSRPATTAQPLAAALAHDGQASSSRSRVGRRNCHHLGSSPALSLEWLGRP
jgi:hypothetical protein